MCMRRVTSVADRFTLKFEYAEHFECSWADHIV
jgi:hypothetical protein